MKRKTEDQLVRLAFGDLSPEEASRLQAESTSNPDAARTLAMYRQMKEELRGLAEVPPDQLSKERLREAILKRGLKEKPLQRSYSWLWMPAAAAALAFGVVMVKGRVGQGINPGTPTLVSDVRTPSFTDLPNLKIDPSIRLNMPAMGAKPVENPTDEATENTGDAERSVRRSRNYGDRHRTRLQDTTGVTFSYGDPGILSASSELPKDKAELRSPMTFDSANKDPGRSNESTQEATAPAPGSMALRDGSVKRGSKSTAAKSIIVIQPETDDQTGARKAKEVEKTSDVLVGG